MTPIAPLVLDEQAVRALIDPVAARMAVRDAFIALHRGRVTLPIIMDLHFAANNGEAHVKGAHLHQANTWTVKVATGFYDNPKVGLPVTSGLSLVFSAETGQPAAVLMDNGYLTELRTGAAGALATDLLARADARRALIVGAGGQARFQAEALLCARRIDDLAVWSRRPEQAEQAAAELSALHQRPVRAVTDLRSAVGLADIIITVTASRKPLIEAGWLTAGTHVTAVGSDMPEKQELAVEVLAAADIVCVDDVAVAGANGELHHALEAGALNPGSAVTLGAVVAGASPGRTDSTQVTIADLCGLGIQDAGVADVVVRRAHADRAD